MMKRFWDSIVHIVKRVGWRRLGIIAAVLVAMFVVANALLKTPQTTAAVESSVPQVELRSIAELASQSSPLSLAGTVSSQSQANVSAQSGGQVAGVYRSLGQYVSAGTIVAELESSSQRAAVLQAQGSVAAAQAALSKISGPSRPEQLTVLQAAVDAANSGAVNTLLSAYSSVDSAVRGTADTMISNADTSNPQFFIQSSNSQLPLTINNLRLSINSLLNRQKARAGTLSSSDNLPAELEQTLSEVRTARTLLDTIIQALNSAIATNNVSQATINADLAAATGARTSLTASLSALAGAQSAITNAKANLSQGNTGGDTPDVAGAEAQLTVAQGGLAAARANLEKALLRAPISGTINSISLKVGDYVSPSVTVATIANNGALEITAYITEKDSSSVSAGSKVGIEGGSSGVITRVAPALDPVTKKIEVKIGVTKDAGLINGQSVLVELPHTSTSAAAAKGPLSIPISAIKVGASEIDVFSVEDGVLVAHAVTLGQLSGDKVEIVSGVTPSMLIVTDARGLHAGQVVEVRS